MEMRREQLMGGKTGGDEERTVGGREDRWSEKC